MACPDKPLDPESQYIGNDVIITCILLLLCLVFSLVGNIWVLMKFGTANTKRYHQGDTMIPRAIAILGFIHALLNIPVYMTSIIAGRWLFGTVFCQLFGLISSITLGTWMWFFTLASMERFFRIVLPNEYSSMFSDINTKILLWGTVLFVGMVFTGPIYGWAEYSDRRDGVQILLISQSKETGALSPLTRFLTKYSNDTHLIQSLLQNISSFFHTNFQSEIRLGSQVPNGFGAMLRSQSRDQIMCLWNEIENKSIDSMVGRYFSNCRGIPKGDSELFTVMVEEHMYKMYSDVTLTYQESVTCGLDFSQVNKHIYSFLGFCSVLLLVIPVLANGYFYTRIKCSSVHKSIHSRTHRQNIQHEKDIFISNIYAIGTTIAFSFQATFLAINILGGINTPLSKWTFLASYLLMYSCSMALPVSLAMLKGIEFLKTVLCCCNRTDDSMSTKSGTDPNASLTAKSMDEGYTDLEMVTLCTGVGGKEVTNSSRVIGNTVNSSDLSGCDSDINPNTTDATNLIGNGNTTESTNVTSNYFAAKK